MNIKTLLKSSPRRNVSQLARCPVPGHRLALEIGKPKHLAFTSLVTSACPKRALTLSFSYLFRYLLVSFHIFSYLFYVVSLFSMTWSESGSRICHVLRVTHSSGSCRGPGSPSLFEALRWQTARQKPDRAKRPHTEPLKNHCPSES